MSKNVEGESAAILLTTFNRIDMTRRCLQQLYSQDMSNISLRVILVDDGSTDGTPKMIKGEFPEVTLIEGHGEQYWCGGMRTAMEEAFRTESEYFIWLNDDVRLYDGVIVKAIEESRKFLNRKRELGVFVGAVEDVNGNQTYGGMVRSSKWHPLRFSKVLCKGEFVECDTMNGNFVVVPKEAAFVIGNIDSNLTHKMGDFDYGLTAKSKGVGVFMLPFVCGECENDNELAPWNNFEYSVRKRLSFLLSQKGVPFRETIYYMKKHTRFIWLLLAVFPYLKFFIFIFIDMFGFRRRQKRIV